MKRKSDGLRKTILYSKYLLGIKLGRVLAEKEEVDHIDGNKINDSIDNLQILTREENRKKYFKTLNRKVSILKCDFCGISFNRFSNQVKKNQKRSFSSKQCLYNFQKIGR